MEIIATKIFYSRTGYRQGAIGEGDKAHSVRLMPVLGECLTFIVRSDKREENRQKGGDNARENKDYHR
jgi:hypothetical protein